MENKKLEKRVLRELKEIAASKEKYLEQWAKEHPEEDEELKKRVQKVQERLSNQEKN